MSRPLPRLVPLSTLNLRVEYDSNQQTWVLWQHANKDFTRGTYIELHPDGRISRTTIHEDGGITEHGVEVRT